jgi:hypothetical protein
MAHMNPRLEMSSLLKALPAPVLVSPRQDNVAEAGDAGCGVGQCVVGAPVVAQDLVALHLGQGVFDVCSDGAVLITSRIHPTKTLRFITRPKLGMKESEGWGYSCQLQEGFLLHAGDA